MKILNFSAVAVCMLAIQASSTEPPSKSSQVGEKANAPVSLGEALTKADITKWGAIKRTQPNLLHADRILRTLAELESVEAEDWRTLTRNFAAFKDAAGNSPFNGLPVVNDLVTLWSLHISARGSNVVQVVSASQAQARYIESLVQGNIRGSVGPTSQADASVSGKVEYKQRSNEDGSVSMTISGGTLGGILLAAREQARSRMQKQFWDNGFRKQVEASNVIGKWRWRENTLVHGVIVFDLQADGKMFAEVPYSGVIKHGKGTWSLIDNKLTITGTHVGALGVYLKKQLETWITDREVLFSDDRVILLKGKDENRLDRIDEKKK